MKNTSKCKRCGTCDFCKAAYRNHFYFFCRDRAYYCEACRRLTSPSETCPDWRKREKHCDLSPQRFDGVIKDIAVISEYFDKLELGDDSWEFLFRDIVNRRIVKR